MSDERDYSKYEADLHILQRLRLARRRCYKMEKEYEKAYRRVMKARRKLFEALDACEAAGLDQLDPRAMD